MEVAESADDLMTSQSIKGESSRDFEMLDARIASALRMIISNTSFRRRVSVEEQRAQKYNRFLRGRQIAKLRTRMVVLEMRNVEGQASRTQS